MAASTTRRSPTLTYAVDAFELATYAANGDGFIGLGIDFAVLGALAVAVYVAGQGAEGDVVRGVRSAVGHQS